MFILDKTLNIYESIGYFCISSRPEQREEPRPVTSGAQKSASSGGGVGMWLKLVFLVSVAVLVYLVIINMNPSAESKIPLTLDKKGQ